MIAKNYNPFSLYGKKILVTGASSGIGQSIAVECSKMGGEMVVTGRNIERLHDTMLLLSGSDHVSISADITSNDDLSLLVSKCPVLDGLVLCAGKSEMAPLLFCTRDKFNSLFDVNFFPQVELLRLLVKNKKIAAGGSVVMIASIGGTPGGKITTANAAYGATKAALVSIMKYAAKEFAPKKIRVNSINPGMIVTNMLRSGIVTDEQHQRDMENYPLKRYGRPEDVSAGAVYLLSDAASWVTGHSLVIDGGITI
jgi:NAD(P)-dependent dehydrogenase (short-subunit alcohol dehydrogenase family)